MGRASASLARPRGPAWGAYLELLKPITWFPPMWAFACGLVASGAPLLERWPLIVAGVALAGPLICGTSQVVNDWFDRHVDAHVKHFRHLIRGADEESYIKPYQPVAP